MVSFHESAVVCFVEIARIKVNIFWGCVQLQVIKTKNVSIQKGLNEIENDQIYLQKKNNKKVAYVQNQFISTNCCV